MTFSGEDRKLPDLPLEPPICDYVYLGLGSVVAHLRKLDVTLHSWHIEIGAHLILATHTCNDTT